MKSSASGRFVGGPDLRQNLSRVHQGRLLTLKLVDSFCCWAVSAVVVVLSMMSSDENFTGFFADFHDNPNKNQPDRFCRQNPIRVSDL